MSALFPELDQGSQLLRDQYVVPQDWVGRQMVDPRLAIADCFDLSSWQLHSSCFATTAAAAVLGIISPPNGLLNCFISII